MSKRVKRSLLPLFGALIASLIFVLSQSSILAQSTLTKAAPADNQVFKTNEVPDRVTLTFSEKLKPDVSTLQVVNTIRNRADNGKVTVNGNDISVELIKNPGKPFDATDYSVEYSVVSDVDGTTTNGSYNFKVVPPPGNPLDAGYLFSTPNSVFGENWSIYFPWALVAVIGFLIGAIISNLIYFYGKYRFRNNRLTYTMINRASRNAAIAFSLGVFFFLCRLGNLQPFNARLWLYLTALLVLYYIIRGVIWRVRVYPKAKAEWLEIQARQQRKRGPEPATAPIPAAKAPAKAVATGAIASGSGDAGGEEKLNTSTVRDSATPDTPETPRGLSQRGQKRRDKKRDRR